MNGFWRHCKAFDEWDDAMWCSDPLGHFTLNWKSYIHQYTLCRWTQFVYTGMNVLMYTCLHKNSWIRGVKLQTNTNTYTSHSAAWNGTHGMEPMEWNPWNGTHGMGLMHALVEIIEKVRCGIWLCPVTMATGHLHFNYQLALIHCMTSLFACIDPIKVAFSHCWHCSTPQLGGTPNRYSSQVTITYYAIHRHLETLKTWVGANSIRKGHSDIISRCLTCVHPTHIDRHTYTTLYTHKVTQ